MPLVILCIGAVGAGYLGVFGGTAEGGWFHNFLSPVTSSGMPLRHLPAGEVAKAGAEGEHIGQGTMMAISGVIAIVGILLAWFFYAKNRAASAAAAQKMNRRTLPRPADHALVAAGPFAVLL